MFEATLSVQAAELTRISEEWLAAIIGVGIFALAPLSLAGLDTPGWLATTSVWTDPSTALASAWKAYATLGRGSALILTYLALLAVLSAGSFVLREDVSGSPSPSPPCSPSAIPAGSLAAGRASLQ
jgi:hypothetical protein